MAWAWLRLYPGRVPRSDMLPLSHRKAWYCELFAATVPPTTWPWLLIPRPSLGPVDPDRKSTRLNSSHITISYAVFCLKKKKKQKEQIIKPHYLRSHTTT